MCLVEIALGSPWIVPKVRTSSCLRPRPWLHAQTHNTFTIIQSHRKPFVGPKSTTGTTQPRPPRYPHHHEIHYPFCLWLRLLNLPQKSRSHLTRTSPQDRHSRHGTRRWARLEQENESRHDRHGRALCQRRFLRRRNLTSYQWWARSLWQAWNGLRSCASSVGRRGGRSFFVGTTLRRRRPRRLFGCQEAKQHASYSDLGIRAASHPATHRWPSNCTDVRGHNSAWLSFNIEEFAAEFISSTKGWHPTELSDDEDGVPSAEASDDSDDESVEGIWVNDRQHPVYIRGDPAWSRKNSQELDQLLMEHRPNDFSNRILFEQQTHEILELQHPM